MHRCPCVPLWDAQVPVDPLTVEAALACLREGVGGRVKGGLLDKQETAEREAAEREADKAAGCCSCFGPPKRAKGAQRKEPAQQQLVFVADEEKVRAGGGATGRGGHVCTGGGKGEDGEAPPPGGQICVEE